MIKIPLNERWVAVQSKMSERVCQGQPADVAVSAIRLPVMRYVAVLPVFPENTKIDVARAHIIEDRLKRRIRTLAHADQRTEHIE